MTFGAPYWLLLLPILALAAWGIRRLELFRPLRILCLVLLILVLAEPRTRSGGRGLDLWVLIDRSASARDLIEPRLEEIESLLRTSAGRYDRLFLVDYSDTAMVRGEGARERFPGSPDGSDTALAVHHALARISPQRASRILVLSDGFSTAPLRDVSELLARQQVPLDIRLFVPAADVDYQVAAFELPERVQVAEPFLLELGVSGAPDADVPYTVYRDGAPIGEGTAPVRDGIARLRFSDRVVEPGACRYEVELLPAEDAFPGNNRADGWVEILGGPRILLLTAYEDDPVARVLEAQGFDLEIVNDASRLHVGRLSGARAVIFNNVPAYRVAPDVLDALDVFVRVQGGGLLMAGGKYSFGSGGYFESAVDELLPVSMELREEHRKLTTAMAIVLDRSGSMSAGVPGGGTKMDLADDGAARCVELLGDNDAVTVFAVDSQAHRIAPLVQVGPNRAVLESDIRRIGSMGGGIFVYTGLQAAWEELRHAEQGQRHVILFADAADAEEPGQYRTLVEEMVRAGATVSVIGLGTDSDSDAEFLKDIAARGNGRIFFNADPSAIPALFAQETVAVARSAFLEEPVGVAPTAGWLEIAARPLEWLDSLDGYNLSYLRDEAGCAAFTADEYGAPLVAFWQRGAGRSAAVAFPLGGDFSQSVRAWTQYGDLVQTLTRWIMGEDVPPGVGLRCTLDGTRLDIDLLYDDTWQERIVRTPPRVALAEGASGDVTYLAWERLAPGHFQASTSLAAGRYYRGAVRLGAVALPFGPLAVGTRPEWAFDPDRVEELRTVSRVSGGEERVDLSTAWAPTLARTPRDLRPWLLVAWVVVFLAEALQSRIGWNLPEIPQARALWETLRGLRIPVERAEPAVRSRRAREKRDAAAEKKESPAAPKAASHDEQAASRRARYLRAKRGR